MLLKIREDDRELMLQVQVWNGQREGSCAGPNQFTLKMRLSSNLVTGCLLHWQNNSF